MSGDPPELIRVEAILRNPQAVAEHLVASRAIYGLVGVEVRVATRTLVCFWMTLEPWIATASEGYPTEQVAISVWASGQIVAVPVDPTGRLWLHRNLAADLGRWSRSRRDLHNCAPPLARDTAIAEDWQASDPRLLGELCLWFPGDPRSLRWEWSDGFAAFVTVVHRHLQAEEFWRRTGRWPAEDAPHGDGAHPIRTSAMRRAAMQGAA